MPIPTYQKLAGWTSRDAVHLEFFFSRSSPRVSTTTPGRRVATSGLPSFFYCRRCITRSIGLPWLSPMFDKLSKVLESAVDLSTGLAGLQHDAAAAAAASDDDDDDDDENSVLRTCTASLTLPGVLAGAWRIQGWVVILAALAICHSFLGRSRQRWRRSPVSKGAGSGVNQYDPTYG